MRCQWISIQVPQLYLNNVIYPMLASLYIGSPIPGDVLNFFDIKQLKSPILLSILACDGNVCNSMVSVRWKIFIQILLLKCFDMLVTWYCQNNCWIDFSKSVIFFVDFGQSKSNIYLQLLMKLFDLQIIEYLLVFCCSHTLLQCFGWRSCLPLTRINS